MGDTLIRLGGSQVDVQLRRNQELTLDAGLHKCPPVTLPPWIENSQVCMALATKGCTVPPQPNAQIEVRYRDPAGNPVYHTVTTDASGCFEDMFVTAEGGEWGVAARLGGDECAAIAVGGATLKVPLPKTGDQDRDGLPDAQEVQGDADKDGIPNHLDPDSDDDGLVDGQEYRGDSDGDGTLDVVDPAH